MRWALLFASLTLVAGYEPMSVAQLARGMYKELGDTHGNITSTAAMYQPDYDAINYDGRLGDTLSTLFEIRLLELKTSIQHAKRMLKVIQSMKQHAP
jgi:hypothetical protein